MTDNTAYRIIRFWYGCVIEKTTVYSKRPEYLKTVYNGEFTWCYDSTYAKTYKTEKAAENVIKKILQWEETAMRYKVVQIIDYDVLTDTETAKTLCNVTDYVQAVNICYAHKNSYVIRSDNEIPYRNMDLPFSTVGRTF